jgi:hypothetical protein
MATKKGRTLAAKTSMTATTAPSPQGVFGLVIDVNGTPVTINSDTIADIKTKGIEMGITEPVELGSFQQMIGYINTTFSVSIPTDPTGLPAPLPAIISKVESLNVTILKAHFKIPGTQSADQNTLYTLVMSVMAPAGGDVVKVGPLGVKGAVIGVTNEPPAS